MILLLLGCGMSLDGFFFANERVEDYGLADQDLVPIEHLEEVSFPSTDGTTLYGVWARQDPDAAAPILVYFHGNSGSIATYWERLAYYWSWGTHDVFIFDYRCYGKSEGECSYEGVIEEDGLAAVQHVVETTGVPAEQIAWLGHSLGGAVAVHTSDEVGAQSVTIEATFASADDLLDDGTGTDMPPGWFFEDEWDNRDAIALVKAPIFVIHGLEDDYIQPSYAEILYERAPDPKELWLVEGAGHSDAYEVVPDEYRERVLAFQAAH